MIEAMVEAVRHQPGAPHCVNESLMRIKNAVHGGR